MRNEKENIEKKKMLGIARHLNTTAYADIFQLTKQHWSRSKYQKVYVQEILDPDL